MKVLVAGGSGYLGSAVCEALLQLGHDVVGTSRAAPGFLHLDIGDSRATESLLEEGAFDAILNLAATGVTPGSSGADEMIAINAHGAAALAKAASAVSTPPWYVHIASSTEPLLGETPESAYSASKAAGTTMTRDALEAAGMAYSIVTIHNAYGSTQPTGRFVVDVMRSLLRRETVRIEHPSRVRDFCYIDDVVTHVTTVVERGSTGGHSTREIGTGQGTSLRALAELACEILGVPSGLVIAKEESGEDPHAYRVADSFAAGFLGCTTPLSVGLTRLVDAND
jgi:nucleoside-diphosphate-sugar epimerase